jgi:hypothetical protein
MTLGQTVDHAGETPIASAWLSRVVAGAGLLLLAFTWRLWTPQTVFPQLPFFRWAEYVPAQLQWLGFGLMVAGLCCALGATRDSRAGRAGLITFAVATIGMVLIDQHRLQPWAYQLVVAAVVLACAPGSRGVLLLRILTISLYFHSALSKLDFSFLETNGQQLVGAVLEPLGLALKFWSAEMRRGAAVMLPIGELLVAVGLAVPRLRRWGLYSSLAMHVLLLVALGPWGMNHQPAVLIWNVYFIAQNYLLFGTLRRKCAAESSFVSNETALQRGSLRANWRWVDVLVVAVVLLPLLEPLGRFDHWPSWAVYAAHPAVVRVSIDKRQLDNLPDSARAHLGPNNPFCRWRPVHIDRWSLDALAVPIYPQDRFQLGVAIALTETDGLKGGIRVVIDGRADRWTGHRSRRELIGRTELLREAKRFWLNASPRRQSAQD